MAYDISSKAVKDFAAEISEKFNLEVQPVEDPQEAVKGCDLVVTAGPILKIPHATIQVGWLEAGAFASLVDFDSYWHPKAMKEVDKFCTDDVPQLLHYRDAGYFQDIPPIYADLGDLIAGKVPGRESAKERIMTCNLGLAMDDMAVAPAIFQKAVEKNLGTWLPM